MVTLRVDSEHRMACKLVMVDSEHKIKGCTGLDMKPCWFRTGRQNKERAQKHFQVTRKNPFLASQDSAGNTHSGNLEPFSTVRTMQWDTDLNDFRLDLVTSHSGIQRQTCTYIPMETGQVQRGFGGSFRESTKMRKTTKLGEGLETVSKEQWHHTTRELKGRGGCVGVRVTLPCLTAGTLRQDAVFRSEAESFSWFS